MSLFKRPKKPMQPRVFTSNDDDADADARMDVDADEPPPALTISNAQRPAKQKPQQSVDKPKKPSLLSFDHEGNSLICRPEQNKNNTNQSYSSGMQMKAAKCSRCANRRTARK